jgi:hypothetical protein
MKHNKPIVIIILMSVLLFLLILNICLNKKNTRENFQSNNVTKQVNESSEVDEFKNTHEFVEYSRNSDKLKDMFQSLEDAESKCEKLEYDQIQREEKNMMRENDKVYKELQEQDKKIHELKEIVKYLTIEKKRRDKINKNCMNNKQRKLNENYNIVKSLSESGFVRDNTVDLDLNISESEKLKKFLSSVNNKKDTDEQSRFDSDVRASDSKKCRAKGSNDINLDEFDKVNKCYGCSADKLKKAENYIKKDFN